MVLNDADNARLLGLLDDARKIVVVGMGELGRITRIAASLLGSPFTFASQGLGKETARGQIDHETLRTLLRGLAPGGRAAGCER
jgi:3-dehydroquinate dehydratase-1